MEPNTNHRYVPSLDGLRAIAIAGVMAYHSGDAPGGGFGVDIFLVLSGYLITSLLVAERHRAGSINIGRFYLRRVLRLLPAVVITVFVFVGLGEAILSAQQSHGLWADVGSIFGYYANFWEAIKHMVYFGHFWSLSLEEQYYFIWPLLLLVLCRRIGERRLAYAFASLCLLSWLLGVVWWDVANGMHDNAGIWISDMLPTRGLGLFVGSALALAVRAELLPTSERFHRVLGVLAGGAVVLWVVLFRVWPYQSVLANRDAVDYGFLVIDLSTAAVLLHVTSRPSSRLSRLLSLRPLVVIGIWSYSLYLVHLPIFILFGHSGLNTASRKVLMYLTAVLAAAVLHEFVEKPFLRLRDRGRAHQRAAEPARPAIGLREAEAS